MNVGSIVATAASGTVVLAALAHVARKVVKFCQDLAAAARIAAVRSAQLEPNGGSSMRDAVNRIEAHLKRQDEHLETQDRAIAELQSKAPRWRRY